MLFANILAPLTNAEQWVLERLHSLGFGWGLAIVGLTIIVRMFTIPLVVRQFHSARELREHMPEMKKLQARFKHDKPRLQKEMQAYYKEHGINPLASFAPMLVQIPIFISLYYLMRHDVKNGLFGSDGFLFIPHLTAKPTGGVLVILILAYLIAQVSGSLIATRQMQGGQKWLMLGLPAVFVSIVARFPAGLAVYWITTSLWTLGQQFVLWRVAPDVPLTGGPVTSEIEGAKEKPKAKAKTNHKPKPKPKPKPAVAAAVNGNGNGSRASSGPSAQKSSRKRKRAHGRRR